MTWDKTSIQNLLKSNDRAVYRALVAIFDRQTASEQSGDTTNVVNGIGFSRFDAPFCSDLAKRVKAGYSLSPKQLAVARNKMMRYHRQLVDVANEREAVRQAIITPAIEAADVEEQINAAEERASIGPDFDRIARKHAFKMKGVEAGGFA